MQRSTKRPVSLEMSGDVDEAKAQQILEKYGASNVNSYAFTGSKPYVA